MVSRAMAVTLSAFVAGGAIAGHGASGPEQESPLFPKPKSHYFTRLQVPAPETTKPQQPTAVVVQPGTVVAMQVPLPEPRSFTPRIVCGMKMFEGTSDLDPRIVEPIPERHNAKIRILGPAPCDGPPPVVVQVPERIR